MPRRASPKPDAQGNTSLVAVDVEKYFSQLPTHSGGGAGRFALALHGGASDLVAVPESKRRAFGADASALLTQILAAGQPALARGASALDVAEAAVRAMEDSGVLNAGRGSTRNRDGDVQMDAAIMDGRGPAGAVAAVHHLRNPVAAARMVMERSPHVLLAGADAERFAVELGATAVATDYFRAGTLLAPADADTVGAVALDCSGNLAAATSTGGIFGKLPGRVGDSPVIGAGTFADNATAAVSATGQGEYFMRLVLAHDVAAMVRYGGLSLADAGARAIRDKLGAAGGRGGLIAVDRSGAVVMEFNTEFMPRGLATAETGPRVAFGIGACA